MPRRWTKINNQKFAKYTSTSVSSTFLLARPSERLYLFVKQWEFTQYTLVRSLILCMHKFQVGCCELLSSKAPMGLDCLVVPGAHKTTKTTGWTSSRWCGNKLAAAITAKSVCSKLKLKHNIGSRRPKAKALPKVDNVSIKFFWFKKICPTFYPALDSAERPLFVPEIEN